MASQQEVSSSDAEQSARERVSVPSVPRDFGYYRAVFAGRRMPFAYVDLDLFEANIRQVVQRTAGKRVRVASKSVRSVAMLRRLLASDTTFIGLMCYSPREAVFLADQGFDDLLLGYPIWHRDDLDEVARAVASGAKITSMVDNVAHIERIEMVAREHGVRLPLCVDMDMSIDMPGLHFGVWRSPLRSVADARPVLERIAASQHVTLDGLMGYEAQIAGVGDAAPGQAAKNMLVRQLKHRSARAAAERRQALWEMARGLGLTPRIVNGGGTGSILTTRNEPAVTEITVGSAFYGPGLFDAYRDFRYQPAAAFAVEIVRQPQPAIYTCLGGGYVASGSAGREKLPYVYLPAGAQLLPLEGAGEVQTPVRYIGHEQLKLGDPIFLRHAKAGELCERFPRLLLVQDGAVVDEVSTYRGDGQCFI
ncbi:MAG TPA: amino acid deaminase/aldolase [Ktedonobacterales bacterium]|nr:amino acid deaminase/aldolase [Ktedonobacterales bacterium]